MCTFCDIFLLTGEVQVQRNAFVLPFWLLSIHRNILNIFFLTDSKLSMLQVNEESVLGSPKCDFVTTSNLQGFSSGFTVPTINPIDFKRIFANFSELLGKNPAVFVTVFLSLGLYIILAVWARRADRKDVEKVRQLPVSKNNHHSPSILHINEILWVD